MFSLRPSREHPGYNLFEIRPRRLLLLWDRELFIISKSDCTVQHNENNTCELRLTILGVGFSF